MVFTVKICYHNGDDSQNLTRNLKRLSNEIIFAKLWYPSIGLDLGIPLSLKDIYFFYLAFEVINHTQHTYPFILLNGNYAEVILDGVAIVHVPSVCFLLVDNSAFHRFFNTT